MHLKIQGQIFGNDKFLQPDRQHKASKGRRVKCVFLCPVLLLPSVQVRPSHCSESTRNGRAHERREASLIMGFLGSAGSSANSPNFFDGSRLRMAKFSLRHISFITRLSDDILVDHVILKMDVEDVVTLRMVRIFSIMCNLLLTCGVAARSVNFFTISLISQSFGSVFFAS